MELTFAKFLVMEKILFDKTYFNVKDTLTCGQFFAYEVIEDKFLIRSLDKFALCYNQGDYAIIECESENVEYFFNFFDLKRDYSSCYEKAISFNVPILTKSANLGRGIRILKQDKYETLINFIISQNNNIPRITKSIKYLCDNFGREVKFMGKTYHAFPSLYELKSISCEDFKNAGLGYRAEYVCEVANLLFNNKLDLDYFADLGYNELERELMYIKGVGQKVANCVMLFAYSRFDAFPVDTWIEKIYIQDFAGTPTTRDKITNYFISLFGQDSGIIQQYLFHYKRNLD